MINRSVLALSSIIAGSLLTLTAAPAKASHLDSAWDLVANITPATNVWGISCSINFTSYTATTNGACFFTLSLQDDDPTITPAVRSIWWGSTNPSAGVYCNQINAQNKFTKITTVGSIQEGDLLVACWTNSNGTAGGYVMIVDVAPSLIMGSTTRYLVSILDSTSSPHGPTDSRWQAEVPAHDGGVGAGDIYIDVDGSDQIVAHTWSTTSGGTSYPQTGAGARPMVVGRFVR